MNQPRIRPASSAVAAIIIAGLAASALAQNGLPYTIEAPPDSVYFGSRVASGGDANHDGHDDIFVVDDAAGENVEVAAKWHMYSGVDGSLLWSGTDGQILPAYSISTAEFLGDVDGDDCDDVILGRSRLSDSRGGVDVFSGRTGDLLYSYRGDAVDDWMGWCVAGLGDLNGDDVPDFAFDTRFTADGELSIRSGRDGSEIRAIAVAWPRQVRNAGDIDGDLIGDIAISSWHNTQRVDVVSTISGADGHVIWELTRDSFGGDHDFGYQLEAGTDVTGDHVPDVLASGDFLDGTSYLISGQSGTIEMTYTDDFRFTFNTCSASILTLQTSPGMARTKSLCGEPTKYWSLNL